MNAKEVENFERYLKAIWDGVDTYVRERNEEYSSLLTNINRVFGDYKVKNHDDLVKVLERFKEKIIETMYEVERIKKRKSNS